MAKAEQNRVEPPVNDSECKMLADAMGWETYDDEYCWKHLDRLGLDRDLMAYLEDGQWHPTDAGAWNVQIEKEIELTRYGSGDEAYRAGYRLYNQLGRRFVWAADPKEAVAQAGIAQLEVGA